MIGGFNTIYYGTTLHIVWSRLFQNICKIGFTQIFFYEKIVFAESLVFISCDVGFRQWSACLQSVCSFVHECVIFYKIIFVIRNDARALNCRNDNIVCSRPFAYIIIRHVQTDVGGVPPLSYLYNIIHIITRYSVNNRRGKQKQKKKN